MPLPSFHTLEESHSSPLPKTPVAAAALIPTGASTSTGVCYFIILPEKSILSTSVRLICFTRLYTLAFFYLHASIDSGFCIVLSTEIIVLVWLIIISSCGIITQASQGRQHIDRLLTNYCFCLKAFKKTAALLSGRILQPLCDLSPMVFKKS